MLNIWISDNYIEIFGAITGIIYVFLEIRQTIWLWPLGIITSGVYVWIFFTNKLYADMSLQAYYVAISVLGWYWWARGSGLRAQGAGQVAEGKNSPFEGGQGDVKVNKNSEINTKGIKNVLTVTRISIKLASVLFLAFLILYICMWFVLSRLTDSPVPEWDAFLTSLSIIATWMLARKIYEHWYLWIVVNILSVVLYLTRGLYPTVVLYAIYGVMSFVGLSAWKKTIGDPNGAQ